MKHLKFVAVFSALCLCYGCIFGAIDKKYYNRIADKVWKTPDSLFIAETEVPDSLIKENSAVIIAWSDDIDVDHIVNNSIYTSSGQTNRMRREHVKRAMVKLLDQSAIEKYSDFEFGYQREIKYRGFTIYSHKEAFGARIHKPGGEIVEVDLSQAIETGDGKKGKDDRYYKLAIPGLEMGDILDYFTYSEELAEGYDLEAKDVAISSNYPVLARRVRISTNPAMTVEFKGYNGVPNLKRLTNVSNRQAAELEVYNLPAINFSRYLMPARQLPFIRIQFLNNNHRRYMSSHARSGGLYANIHTGKIMSEFRDFLKGVVYDSPLNGKALKMVRNNFLKQNPGATARQIADAAYLAVKHSELTGKTESEKVSGSFERALIFTDVLKNLNVYPADSIGVGLINPRSDVPIDDISAWEEARFIVVTPDATYFIPPNATVAPGEMPGEYKGEKGLVYMGNRTEITPRTAARDIFIPGKKLNENSLVTADTITFIDNDRLAMNSTLRLSGGMKSALADFTNSTEWIEEVEKYLLVPANKQYTDKSYDRLERVRENKTDLVKVFENIYGAKPDSVMAADFQSRGITPENPDIVLNATTEFSGLVEPLGNELSLSLGKLAGMPQALKENERKRMLDVMLPFVNQKTHTIVVRHPAGYHFDPASVEALSRNVAQMHGQLFVQAALDDNGDLNVTTVMREKFADVPLALWSNFMDLVDSEAAFGDASVILVKD